MKLRIAEQKLILDDMKPPIDQQQLVLGETELCIAEQKLILDDTKLPIDEQQLILGENEGSHHRAEAHSRRHQASKHRA